MIVNKHVKLLIQVLKHHGTSQQSFVTAMNEQSGEQTFGAKLTYDNAVVLWLLCEQQTLGKLPSHSGIHFTCVACVVSRLIIIIFQMCATFKKLSGECMQKKS